MDYNCYFKQSKNKIKNKFEEGGKVSTNVAGYTLEEYQNLSNEAMMDKEPLSLEEVKRRVFDINEDAYDYEKEIEQTESVDELADFLYEEGLATGDNTYNQSWWGGVRQYLLLNNDGDKADLDYPSILFMSRHRGGDVRGNYEKYEAFELDSYGYEQLPWLMGMLTYEVEIGDKMARFDTEDAEGYDLYVVESDFDEFEADDSTNLDEVEEKLGVDMYL